VTGTLEQNLAQAPGRPRLIAPVHWLVSPRVDLCWILGSVAVAYLMFTAWQLGWASPAVLTAVWIFGFHGPHFWGTVSRTYLDSEERRKRGRLLSGSLLWFLLGPIMVGASLLLEPVTGSRGIEMLFLMFAAVWAYHHVVKQHFGFMALYRAKAQEFGRGEFLFHKWYLIVSLWLPAVIVLANNHHWLLGIPWLHSLRAWLGDSFIIAAGANTALVCTAGFVVLQVLFATHLIWRAARGRGVNLAETLLVLASVPLHWFVLASLFEASPNALDNFMFVPILTIYHNIQYHGLIWHYNTRRYRIDPNPGRHGLAVPLNRTLLRYAICGVLFAVIASGLGHYTSALFTRPWAPLFVGLTWGFAFVHYYLDSKIWHVRQDKNLRSALGFPEPSTP